MDLLIKNGLTFSRHYDKHIIKDIKEKKCYVSDDFETEMVNFKEHTSSKEIIYELPDKQVINIGNSLNDLTKRCPTNPSTRNFIQPKLDWSIKFIRNWRIDLQNVFLD
jgi:hypothetical protein